MCSNDACGPFGRESNDDEFGSGCGLCQLHWLWWQRMELSLEWAEHRGVCCPRCQVWWMGSCSVELALLLLLCVGPQPWAGGHSRLQVETEQEKGGPSSGMSLRESKEAFLDFPHSGASWTQAGAHASSWYSREETTVPLPGLAASAPSLEQACCWGQSKVRVTSRVCSGTRLGFVLVFGKQCN